MPISDTLHSGLKEKKHRNKRQFIIYLRRKKIDKTLSAIFRKEFFYGESTYFHTQSSASFPPTYPDYFFLIFLG